MLPLFCKIFNSVPPSVITEKFLEAVQFTQVRTVIIKDCHGSKGIGTKIVLAI